MLRARRVALFTRNAKRHRPPPARACQAPAVGPLLVHMHHHRRQRSKQLVHDVQTRLGDMALDPRLGRGLPHKAHSFESTASAPSLRAPDPGPLPVEGAAGADQDGGNVKVVVRVRAFVKRGVYAVDEPPRPC